MNNLLRPQQISQYEATKASLSEKLGNKNIHDKNAVRSQLSRVEREFESQRPEEFSSGEKDGAVKQRDELQEKIIRGMPSHEEMRKCPPGAIGRHRTWEKTNKSDIMKWKNLQLRINAGSDDPDVANLERFRPKRSTLNMDNAVISGTDYFMPTSDGKSVVFTDEDIKLLRERAPEEVNNKLAFLTAEQRMIVKQQFITTWGLEDLPEAKQAAAESIEVVESIDEATDLEDLWPGSESESE